MIINLKLITNEKEGDLSPVSAYQPNKATKDITIQVMKDFNTGSQIQNTPYNEFNRTDVITRMNRDQMAFNNAEPFISDNPDDQWRSTAIRPITRNKCISIAAHIVGSNLFPKIFAQNENDEEDKDAAEVMRNLVTWAADQADYEQNFLYGTIAALVNPAVLIHEEFTKVTRTVKDIQPNGSFKESEIVDEDMSGFNLTLVPVDELFIENIYENNIQKQGFLIWRRVIDYSVAQLKYRNVENFEKFVRPGIQIMLGDDQDSFYEQYDEELHGNLVEEIIYYNKQLDLQLVFVNGVIMTAADAPNPRKDKRYPFAKTGYELLDEGKFFYYKSLSFKLAPDQDVIDTLYRMVIDGTYLKIMPPVAIVGTETVGASVIAPGMTTTFKNPNTSVAPIDNQASLTEGRATMVDVEQSLNESSQDPSQAGVSAKGEQTAFEISRLEQNARIQLGLFGRMMGFLIKDLGELLVSDIIQHITVGEIKELASGDEALKFSSFLIPEQEGETEVKRVEFDMEMPEEMTEKEKLARSFEIMDKEGGLESKNRISIVNPTLFRKLKFLVRISPDVMFPPSDNVKRALQLEEYDRAINNPLADQEAIYKDLLLGAYDKTRSNPDKYVTKQQQQPLERASGGMGEGPLASILGAEGIKSRQEIGV